VFSWNVQRDLVERTIRKGASGYLSKSLTAEQIVEGIEKVHDGEVVVPFTEEEDQNVASAWPGRDHGLSPREAEVLALITQGLSNQEIAQRTYLSINSVKTYIRTAYRKIGVTRRAQAVVWGITHGFEPDRSRSLEERESR
jgi:DNA-binding NarL/FixJ family response regulator